MSRSDFPWSVLPRPRANELLVLRVDPDSTHSFFWARKSDGQPALVLSLQRDPDPSPSLPRVRGVDVIWRPQDRQLQIVLDSAGDEELFHALCVDLVRACARSPDEVACLQALASRLERWQRFMSRDGPRILTDEEIRGLFAELLLLETEILQRYGSGGVSCWQGPDALPHDFLVDGVAVEVKSRVSGSKPEVAISSLDQLSDDGVELFLWVQELSPSPSAGRSLRGLVDEIRRRLSGHAHALAELEARLESVRYMDLADYDEYRFLPGATSAYAVGPQFPRLTRQSVPGGVASARYAIELDACEPFRRDVRWPSAVSRK